MRSRVAVLGLVMMLAACGQAAPSRLSPHVPEEQLDLSQYVGKPCELLRPDRASRRHLLAPGTPTHDDSAPACHWAATDADHPTVTAQAITDHGLESVYQHRASYGSFEPTAITHYPAVLTAGPGRVPANGACTTQVGVAEDNLLVVTADYHGTKPRGSTDPCLDSNTVAFEIIQQIRAGNP